MHKIKQKYQNLTKNPKADELLMLKNHNLLFH